MMYNRWGESKLRGSSSSTRKKRSRKQSIRKKDNKIKQKERENAMTAHELKLKRCLERFEDAEMYPDDRGRVLPVVGTGFPRKLPTIVPDLKTKTIIIEDDVEETESLQQKEDLETTSHVYVKIKNWSFQPDVVCVEAGGEITFSVDRDNEAESHMIECSELNINNAILRRGESLSFRVNENLKQMASYRYSDVIYSFMSGTIRIGSPSVYTMAKTISMLAAQSAQLAVSKAESEICVAIQKKEKQGSVFVQFGTLKTKFEIRLSDESENSSSSCTSTSKSTSSNSEKKKETEKMIKKDVESNYKDAFDSDAVIEFLNRRWQTKL